jgi:hypothetical protein
MRTRETSEGDRRGQQRTEPAIEGQWEGKTRRREEMRETREDEEEKNRHQQMGWKVRCAVVHSVALQRAGCAERLCATLAWMRGKGMKTEPG